MSWRNIVSEPNEGLLGHPEHDRGGSAVIPANSPPGADATPSRVRPPHNQTDQRFPLPPRLP
jgi:hypothetical protein